MNAARKICMLVSAFSTAVLFGNEELAKLEQQVLSHRRAIRSAVLTVDVQISKQVSGELRDVSSCTYRLVVDGADRRTDIGLLHRYSNNQSSRGVRSLVVGNLGAQYYNVDNGPTALYLFDVSRSADWKQMKNDVFDPRLLGLNVRPFTALSSAVYGDFVGGDSPRTNVEVQEQDVGGSRRAIAKFLINGTVDVQMDLDRDRGPNLLSAVVTDGGRGDAITCDLEKYAGDIWFPKTVTFVRTVDNIVVEREVATVTTARFNVDIDRNEFALSGLGVPAGTIVVDNRGNGSGRLIWDGKEVVRVGRTRTSGIGIHEVTPRWPLVGLVGGGLLISIGLAMAGKALQTRHVRQSRLSC